MADGFQAPLVRIPFYTRPHGVVPTAWPDLVAMLEHWTVRGCAHIEKGGRPLDITSLGTVTPTDLAGAELVVFHDHVEALFPAQVAWLAE
jgi:hypothetical protein